MRRVMLRMLEAVEGELSFRLSKLSFRLRSSAFLSQSANNATRNFSLHKGLRYSENAVLRLTKQQNHPQQTCEPKHLPKQPNSRYQCRPKLQCHPSPSSWPAQPNSALATAAPYLGTSNASYSTLQE